MQTYLLIGNLGGGWVLVFEQSILGIFRVIDNGFY